MKIISVATIIFLIVLFLTIIFYFSQDRRILITRDETGGEVTEQQIRIKTKSDDDIYTLEIHPKGYTKAQITQAFDRGEAYLRKHLVAKNKSLNEVVSITKHVIENSKFILYGICINPEKKMIMRKTRIMNLPDPKVQRINSMSCYDHSFQPS